MSDTDKSANDLFELSSDELFSIIDASDIDTIEREISHDALFDEFDDNTLPPLQTVTGGKNYIDGEIAELCIDDFTENSNNGIISNKAIQSETESNFNGIQALEENKKKR